MEKILLYIKKKCLGTINDTILSLSSKIVAMIFFLATDIVIARFLTTSEYGEWSFYYAIISMAFWFVWMGINESAKVHIAREKNNIKHQGTIILIGAKLRIVVSFFIVLVLLIICLLIPVEISIFNKYVHLRNLLISGCFLCFFNSISEFIKSVFIGVIHFKNIFVLTIIEFGSNFIFGLVFLVLFKNVIALGWGYVIAASVTSLLGMFLVKKYLIVSGTWIKNVECDKQIVYSILKYARPIFLLSIGALLLTEMDVFMIGIMSSSEETGIYSIAKSLVGKLTHVNLAICTSTMTSFAVLTKDGIVQSKLKFKKILLINTCMLILVSISICLLGPLGIRLLYGSEYSMVSEVMVLLIPYYLGFGISIFYSALVDYQGRANKRLPYYFFMIFLNFIFNYLLIPRFAAKGAAIATSISVIPYVIGLVFVVRKIFKEVEV